MINYDLTQHIGVFYKDRNWANKMFGEYFRYYQKLGYIEKCSKFLIYLKDGSWIEFIPINSEARGYRLNKALYQRGTSYEELTEKIYPLVRCPEVLEANEYE